MDVQRCLCFEESYLLSRHGLGEDLFGPLVSGFLFFE